MVYDDNDEWIEDGEEFWDSEDDCCLWAVDGDFYNSECECVFNVIPEDRVCPECGRLIEVTELD